MDARARVRRPPPGVRGSLQAWEGGEAEGSGGKGSGGGRETSPELGVELTNTEEGANSLYCSDLLQISNNGRKELIFLPQISKLRKV